MVTDPMASKLVQDLKKTGKNVTGASNFIDVKPQLALFKKHELFETTVSILSGNILDPDLLIDFALMEGITQQAQWALNCIFTEKEFHKTAAGRSVEGHTYHPLYVENLRTGNI